jgi:hypothetical protein
MRVPLSRRAWLTAAVALGAAALAVPVGLAASTAPQPHAVFVDPTPTPTFGALPTPYGVAEPPPEPVVAVYSGEPTRLRVPVIGVDTHLKLLRLDNHGELETPGDYARAGWFAGGAAPGDVGPAVIAGHVNNRNGPAVFARLHEVRPGAEVEVERGGQTVRFRVVAVDRYPKDAFPTEKVYGPTPAAELRLITCGGDFDASRRSYVDNIVVYAVLADQ